MSSNIKSRSSTLIYKAYKKLIIPEIVAKLCNIVVLLADSLIAAHFIGLNAMSAITLVAPINLMSCCLFDLLVSGTKTVLIRYKSRGQRLQANRAFGAIVAHAFFWYAIVYSLAFVFSENIFGLFTGDSDLISDSTAYFRPLAIAEPFCAIALCFERGFMTDGKNGFFGVRGIITNCANVIFSIIAVTVFDAGISGIAIASGLSQILGYFWSFSYIFSKSCTIRPDFSVLRNKGEAKKYLHEEMDVGRVYALDDGLRAGASALFSKAIIATGGTVALAAVGVCNAICNIIDSTNGAINSSCYSLITLFHADRDYKGCKRTLNAAIIFHAVFSAFAWIVLNIFPNLVGQLYKVESAEVMHALRLCLCFDVVVTVSDCFTNLFSSFMVATERTQTAAGLAVAFNVMVAVCALIGLSGVSFTTLLCMHMTGAILIACLEAFIVFSCNRNSLESDKAEIQTFSYTLNESSCSEISLKISELLGQFSALSQVSSKAALLAEECNRMILYVNQNNKKNISIDFRVYVDEGDCVITLIDTGILFDPIHRLKDEDLPDEFAISRKILNGLSPRASYARVVNLNVSHLVVPLSRTVHIDGKMVCDDCDGTGRVKCPVCGGQG